MILFRSLTLGLLGACLLLLITRPTLEPRVAHEPPAPTNAVPKIIDLARRGSESNMPGSELAAMLRLAAGERIASIDDVPVTAGTSAGAALGRIWLHDRHFIDIDVVGPGGERRVLVL